MSATNDERFNVPWALTEWVPSETLRAWAAEEIGHLAWENPEVTAYLAQNPEYQPKAMLLLLTLAYATGIFDSEELTEWSFQQAKDPALSTLPPPTAQDVRRFRKDHRALLKWSLAQLIQRAVKHRYALGTFLFPAGLRRACVESATARLDLARHMDRALR